MSVSREIIGVHADACGGDCCGGDLGEMKWRVGGL